MNSEEILIQDILELVKRKLDFTFQHAWSKTYRVFVSYGKKEDIEFMLNNGFEFCFGIFEKHYNLGREKQ